MRRAVLLLVLLAACGDKEDAAPAARGRPVVAATFFPLTDFARRIGGAAVEVTCPLPPDADPIHWRPDRAAVAVFQAADLIVANGAGFEKWLDAVSLPAATFLDTARPFRDRLLRYEDAVVHRHGPAGAHAHEGIDGHTWVDPVLARAQAERILEALVRLRPAGADGFKERFRALAADLEELDRSLRALGRPTLYASHPAYNYTARRYGWRVVNLDLDPAAMPDLEPIRARLRDVPAAVLLWEAAPVAEIARRIEAGCGLRSVVFSPCETPPADGSGYVAAMRANVARLRAALRP